MSRRIGNITIIEPEPDRECELCGKVDETRPYGPGGKRICFDCAQKNPKLTKRMMLKYLYGEDTH